MSSISSLIQLPLTELSSTPRLKRKTLEPHKEIPDYTRYLGINLTISFFSYSNTKDLVTASCVCKRWYQVTRYPSIQQLLARHFVACAKSSEASSLKRKTPQTISLSLLPTDAVLLYFTYLDNRALISVSLVCREYSQLTREKPLQEIFARNFAFGAKAWETYYGKVDEEPPLPSNLCEILARPCPIYQGKRLRDSYILTFVPAFVNGKRLSLKGFIALTQTPKAGYAAKLCTGDDYSAFRRDAQERGEWVFLTREPLPSKSPQEQDALIRNLATSTPYPYKIPDLLRTLVSIVTHFVRSGKSLYANAYTRCLQRDPVTQRQIAIGGSPGKEEGLEICISEVNNCDGIGAEWVLQQTSR